MKLLRLLPVFVLLLTAMTDAPAKTRVQPSLFVYPGADSSHLTAAIQFIIPKGWHMYWTNPGDSGSPAEVEWVLPAGYQVSGLRFPTPKREVHEEMASYAYYDTLTILAEITRPVGSNELAISADLSWVVCSNVCIAESATVSTNGQNAPSRLLSEAIAKMPRPFEDARLQVKGAIVTKTNETIHVSIETDSRRIVEFYPETINDFAIDEASLAVNDGVISFSGRATEGEPRLQTVRGIVITDSGAFQLEAHPRQRFSN